LGLLRPDWESEKWKIGHDDMNSSFDNVVMICELCFQFSTVDFQTYQQKVQADLAVLSCLDCENRLNNEVIYKRCKICTTVFEFCPFFYKCFNMGIPSTCRNCRERKQIECDFCSSKFQMKNCDIQRLPKGHPLLCEECRKRRSFHCTSCATPLKGSFKDNFDPVLKGQKQLLCHPCIKNLKVDTQKCSRCPEVISKYELIRALGKVDSAFVCMRCC